MPPLDKVHLYVYDGNKHHSYDIACRHNEEHLLDCIELSQLEDTLKLIKTLNTITGARLNVGLEVFLHSDRDIDGNLL